MPHFNKNYRNPAPTLDPASPSYQAFLRVFGPNEYAKATHRTAAERYGNSDTITAADRVYFAPQVDKKVEKYARARLVDYEKVKHLKVSSLEEKHALNPSTHKYKYYDYKLPKCIYTKSSEMYA